MRWSPQVQAVIAVFAVGGLLAFAHVISVKFNTSFAAG